ncbi:MAG: sigma-70 family RNA polymerase sigma factor [Phycisphaeraceae bacterium]|nr:sigma-70 family RNA polymerase sigma factor [Phycisphaeraceae bacterium]
MPVDERTLLRRAHRGHDAAARELWASLSPRLLSLARLLLRDGAIDAEDVVQQAFCRMLERSRSEIRSVRHPMAWMTSIVRSVALNARRTNAREHAKRAAIAKSESHTLRDTEDRTLIDALARLGGADREILVLKHTTGLSFDLLAEVVGENRNTLASRHRAALTRLRVVLGEEPAQIDSPSQPVGAAIVEGSRR